MPEPLKEIVASGTWLYDAKVPSRVFIVRVNYDFWFEIAKAENQVEPGEAPELGDDGFLYYVSFKDLDADGSFWPDSGGADSVEKAKEEALSRVPSGIHWDDGV